MTLVKDGAQIQIGAELKIQAKNIPSNKTLEEWKINGKTVSSATKTFSHTIVKEDSDSNGKTLITYTLKNKPVLLKINFNAAQVKVEAFIAEAWKPLSPGEEIAENTQLKLTAQEVPADKLVDKWTFGKTVLSGKGSTFEQTAELSHAQNNTIAISYTLQDIIVNLTFDTEQIKVEAEQAGTWSVLMNGSAVQENTQLRLTAQKVPADKLVQSWKIGNKTVPANGEQLTHTVRKADADGSNSITITYITKNNTLTVAFDSKAIRIFADSGVILADGAEIKEGDRLYLATQNLPDGYTVDTWKIGKQNIPADSNAYEYFVSSNDANDSRTITVSYTTKVAQMITITFDNTKMNVFYSNGPEISSGKKVAEHIRLAIDAENLPAGKKVDTWQIGNKTISAKANHYTYNIESEDADSTQTINIDYTTKDAEKFTLNFDESKMTVEIWQQDGWHFLSNGTQVEEERSVRIKAENLPEGQIVDTWKIGKRKKADKGNKCQYTVTSSDAEGNVISISYTTKNE